MTPREGPCPSRLFSIFPELGGTNRESGNERQMSDDIKGFYFSLGLDFSRDRCWRA
ncbi:MAG: hypothetical protein MUP40_05740 [Actinobacteria bacterium]|nr:hypothetical protein [Actinomycetota bacterium]